MGQRYVRAQFSDRSEGAFTYLLTINNFSSLSPLPPCPSCLCSTTPWVSLSLQSHPLPPLERFSPLSYLITRNLAKQIDRSWKGSRVEFRKNNQERAQYEGVLPQWTNIITMPSFSLHWLPLVMSRDKWSSSSAFKPYVRGTIPPLGPKAPLPPSKLLRPGSQLALHSFFSST